MQTPHDQPESPPPRALEYGPPRVARGMPPLLEWAAWFVALLALLFAVLILAAKAWLALTF